MGINLTLDFGTVTIYEHYMISEMHEGIILGHEEHDVFDRIVETYYPNTPFVYISHRIHSYAVNPIIYLRTSLLRNLVGFAFVSIHKLSLTNAHLEKSFIKKPIYLGRNLEDAIQWANEVIESELQTQLQ